MTLAKTIVELIETYNPQIVADSSNTTNVFNLTSGGVMHWEGVNLGKAQDFDNSLSKSLEYRQLLSAASLQLKLSKSLEYDLNVLPTRLANQFSAVSRNPVWFIRSILTCDLGFSISWPKVIHWLV